MSGAATDAPTAAFFDVDGTLTATTIVDYYAYFRRKTMSAWWGRVWSAAYLVRCLHYLLLDKIDRARLNIVFYRSYAGLSVERIRQQAIECHHDVIQTKQFREAAGCVAQHRAAGRQIVLVTGSIDFIMAPLAHELQVDHVIAVTLVESDGRFTGELTGPPIGTEEKARRIRLFAEERGIDLSGSHAYGDSIADLPMLEAVGHPHAVNPDRALAAKAKARPFPIHHWTIAGRQSGGAS